LNVESTFSGDRNGHRIHCINHRLVACDCRRRARLRAPGRTAMNLAYLAGLVVAAGLLFYLVGALLMAEDL
jgi:hypothetical protein